LPETSLALLLQSGKTKCAALHSDVSPETEYLYTLYYELSFRRKEWHSRRKLH